MADLITSGAQVRDMVRDGWELWHLSPDMLPGRWELRRGAETRHVSWDAIEIIRKRFLGFFREETEEIHQGGRTWIYRSTQAAFPSSVYNVKPRPI